ncbi:MAG TPA: trigger factor [Candidatus Koribacter sp.]
MTTETTNTEVNATPEVAEPINPLLRSVTVEIPVDVVDTERNKLVQQYAKVARVPGFRKGKVPAGVVRNRFQQDINEEIVRNLVPRYFREETQKQNLAPISQPQVTNLHLHDGQPLKFTAEFEILPEISTEGYQSIKVEHPQVTVADEEVEETVSNLREQRATYDPIEDRAAGDGDFVQISFEGRDKADPEAKPVEVPSIMVELGGKNTVDEFTTNLRGTKAGDEKTFDVSYAADYGDQRLAGKNVEYHVTVKSLKKKILPELDDEFIKELGGEFKTPDELRKQIREGMEHEKKHHAEHEGKDKVVDELVKLHDFPVPQAMVESQIEVRLERGLRALAQQGMRAEDMRKMDFRRLRDGQREAATREVKASLLLEKIADAEKIEVSDEELDQQIAGLARQSQQTPEQVRARLTQDGSLDRIRTQIRNEKTLELLYSRSA